MIPDNVQNILYTEDTKLAAALATVGIKPYAPCPTMPVVIYGKNGDPPRTVVRFKFERSDQGIYYVKVWNDRDQWAEFVQQNPEHHLPYIRSAFHNRERYLDAVKQSAVLVFRPGDLPNNWKITIRPRDR